MRGQAPIMSEVLPANAWRATGPQPAYSWEGELDASAALAGLQLTVSDETSSEGSDEARDRGWRSGTYDPQQGSRRGAVLQPESD